MSKILIPLFLLFSLQSNAQIANAFEIIDQTNIKIDGNTVQLPLIDSSKRGYLIEFDSVYLINSVELDQVCKEVEIFGFHAGSFRLITTTNATDQVYAIGAELQYILVRSARYSESETSYFVGLQFSFSK